MATSLRTHHFSVEEFHRMAEAGVFREDDRLELLDGEIVEMTPIGPGHAACVRTLTALLVQRLGDQALVSVQNPVQLGPRSELYPDIAILQTRPGSYAHAHPGPGDVLLLIEVAYSSAEIDRLEKVPRYGRAGIPEVWLVNLRTEEVEVYRNASADGFQAVQTLRRGSPLEPQQLPGIRLHVDEILP